MTSPFSSDSLSHLSIFPLPQAVFFPHTLLPLHIFEPRYRKMIADAIEREAPLAIVRLHEDGSDYFGRAGIHKVAGLGRILEHRKLPDGRYYLLLQGLARVRICEELETPEPYRIVRAELLPDVYPGDLNMLLATRATLQSFVMGLGQAQPRAAAALAEILNATDNPSIIADVIASLLVSDPAARQTLLETPEVIERLEVVTATLAELLSMQEADEEGHLVLN